MQRIRAVKIVPRVGVVLLGATFTSLVPAKAQDLFISSYNQISVTENLVAHYNGSTGAFVENTALNNGLIFPSDITFGPDGNLYVANADGNILRYNTNTRAMDTFVATGSGGLSQVVGVTFGSDGNLYVSDRFNAGVFRFNGVTGAPIDQFVASHSGGLDVNSMARFGPDGNLYVGSIGTNNILRYNGTTGAFLNEFVSAGSGGLNTPQAFVFGPDGNLYVSSSNSNSILRYNGTTGAFIDTFVPFGTGDINVPFGLAFGPDGNLYVANAEFIGGTQVGDVVRFNGTTGAFIDDFVTPGSGNLVTAYGLAFSPALPAASVPEPTALAFLVGLGVTGTAFAFRRLR